MVIPIRHLIASCVLITILSGCRSIQRYGVGGSVFDAESGKPLKNALVMAAYQPELKGGPVTVTLKFHRTNQNGKYSIKDEKGWGVKSESLWHDVSHKYPCLIVITCAGYESKSLIYPDYQLIFPKPGKNEGLSWNADWRECHHFDMINLIFDHFALKCGNYIQDPKVDINRKPLDIGLKRYGQQQLSNGR